MATRSTPSPEAATLVRAPSAPMMAPAPAPAPTGRYIAAGLLGLAALVALGGVVFAAVTPPAQRTAPPRPGPSPSPAPTGPMPSRTTATAPSRPAASAPRPLPVPGASAGAPRRVATGGGSAPSGGGTTVPGVPFAIPAGMPVPTAADVAAANQSHGAGFTLQQGSGGSGGGDATMDGLASLMTGIPGLGADDSSSGSSSSDESGGSDTSSGSGSDVGSVT